MTAHVPIPDCIEDSFGRTVSMILGPISSGVASFNSIVLFAVKIGRGWFRPRRNYGFHRDAISAGALVIRIPIRFDAVIEESPFGWRRLKERVPMIDDGFSSGHRGPDSETSHNNTILCSLPPTSRLTINSLQLFPSSNKLKTAFAILQLIYSMVQASMQYEPMIRNQALSSPFIIAIAYLYMSFINLIANLAQGSYTHVTVIPPMATARTNSIAVPTSPTVVEVNPPNDLSRSEPIITLHVTADQTHSRDGVPTSEELEESGESSKVESDREQRDSINPSQQQQQPPPPPPQLKDLKGELEQWLHTHFPQIEFEEYPSLSSIAFFMHYSIALTVILICIGLLTGFKAGESGYQMFPLLTVILDPILHLLLAVGQLWNGWPRRIMNPLRGLGAVATIKVVTWICNLIGCFFAAKLLFKIYEGESL